MSKSIEDLEPWQTTLGLKIFVLFRFLFLILINLFVIIISISNIVFLLYCYHTNQNVPTIFWWFYLPFCSAIALIYDWRDKVNSQKFIQ